MTISRRRQLQLVVLAYAAIAVYAAVMYFTRYLAALRDPAYSSGGMWAFGDLMLDIFVFFLLLVPTFFLLRYFAQNDQAFTTYSKVALAASLTAPSCAIVLGIWQGVWHNMPIWLQDPLTTRLFWSFGVLLVLTMSRIVGRRNSSKKLLNYAMAIEGVTLVAIVAIFVGMAGAHD